jgi:hypothetical protein
MMEPEEFDEREAFGSRVGSAPCVRQVIPDFTDTPYWVRTFYWVPLIGALAKHWMRSRGRYRPAPPPSPGEGWDDDGVREPRRPRPFAGAGAVEMEEPFGGEDAEWLGDDYVLAGREEPGAPTTAA